MGQTGPATPHVVYVGTGPLTGRMPGAAACGGLVLSTFIREVCTIDALGLLYGGAQPGRTVALLLPPGAGAAAA